MANDTILILPEESRNAASKIETLAGEYEDLYKALYRETDSMTSEWDGKDNVTYTTQIAGFKEDFEKMKNRMEEYARFLRNAAETYEKTQGEIVAAAKKLIN